MTKEEAKLFFPYEVGDDLEELYDERFFEYKNFFLSKIPIKKVFESKLGKLTQMAKAYQQLQLDLNSINVPIELNENNHHSNGNTVFPDNIMDAFNLWEQQKGVCKQRISASTEINSLTQAIKQYIDVTESYRNKWLSDEEIAIELSQLSKEEDPMQVYAAIVAFNNEGGKDFKDILSMKSNLFLLKEMKRLSLLAKKYNSERNI